LSYLFNHLSFVGVLFLEHLKLTIVVIVISLLIAVPLGVMIVRYKWLQNPVLGILSVIYTIPSLSLFVILIPFLGLGFTTAAVALIAYAQIMLVRNWVTGLTLIEPSIIEAARAMGMNGWQLFWQVEMPLAFPFLLAGIRLATLSTIGIGTIAAFISAGGLGTLLFDGVVTANYGKIFAGSLSVAVLAIGANYGLYYLERRAEATIGGTKMQMPDIIN
jgi:osmoprotectant transport system permease protein